MSWVDVTTAISTAAATIVALGLGLRGIYLDRHRERDEELRQARLVMVSGPSFIDATAERGRSIAVKVYNYSTEPIHNVSVNIDIVWRDGNTHVKVLDFDFLGPRGERKVFFDAPPEKSGFGISQPIVHFLDSSGRKFVRDASQPQPKRILGEPKIVIRVVDGKSTIVALPCEPRFRSIMRKVIPSRSGSE